MSKLSIGIVGLPNIGQSTLFQALTSAAVRRNPGALGCTPVGWRARAAGELGRGRAAREAGRIRLEGKEYVVEDGDVMLFRTSA